MDLDAIDPQVLVEIGLNRLAEQRRAHEEAIARASDLLSAPALGAYRQRVAQ